VSTLDDDSMPVRDKSQLLGWLSTAVEQARSFCGGIGVDLDAVAETAGLATTAWKDDSVEKIVVDEQTKSAFLAHARVVNQLFKAVLPDRDATRFIPVASALRFLADSVNSLAEPVDVSRVLDRVQDLLDESVAATPYVIREAPGVFPEAGGDRVVDLNAIDWEAVAKRFQSGKKHTEVERLRAAIKAKVAELVRLNPTREEWLERLQELIDEYNAGSMNVEEMFTQLRLFTEKLDEEEKRTLAEGLDEEQLAVYDLLTRPDPGLTDAEKRQVKDIARELLLTLKHDKLVPDWRKSQQAKAAVKLSIDKTLDSGLPDKYSPVAYREKADAVYGHVLESYWDDGRSVYSVAA
jgi:type I restriction enzyme, R subunit